MDELELKYDSRFIVSYLEGLIPPFAVSLNRIKVMTEEFKNALIQTDHWDQRRLYLLLMFIHFFEPIKTHINEYETQHTKWKKLIVLHLSKLVEKHLNFEYNAAELVSAALNLFFII